MTVIGINVVGPMMLFRCAFSGFHALTPYVDQVLG